MDRANLEVEISIRTDTPTIDRRRWSWLARIFRPLPFVSQPNNSAALQLVGGAEMNRGNGADDEISIQIETPLRPHGPGEPENGPIDRGRIGRIFGFPLFVLRKCLVFCQVFPPTFTTRNDEATTVSTEDELKDQLSYELAKMTLTSSTIYALYSAKLQKKTAEDLGLLYMTFPTSVFIVFFSTLIAIFLIFHHRNYGHPSRDSVKLMCLVTDDSVKLMCLVSSVLFIVSVPIGFIFFMTSV